MSLVFCLLVQNVLFFFFAMLPLSRDGRAKKKCTKTGEDLKEDKKDGMSGKRMGKKNHCKHM